MESWNLAMSALAAFAALASVLYLAFTRRTRVVARVEVERATSGGLHRIRAFLQHTSGPPIEVREVGFVFSDGRYLKLGPDPDPMRITVELDRPPRTLRTAQTHEVYIGLDRIRWCIQHGSVVRGDFYEPPISVRFVDARRRRFDGRLPSIDHDEWRERLGIYQSS